jgi:spore maturation protein CgeB
MQTLEKNLTAIARKQPGMVKRISWPVDSSHVLFGKDGQALYRVHSSAYPLGVSEEQAGSACVHVDGRKQILVFGIGLGEQIDRLLSRFPETGITAWEKDPWLLRLFLMRRDYSQHLASGTLRVSLGTDLVRHAPLPESYTVVYHPLMKEIYRNETGLLVSGIGERKVIINTGGLFVDDAASAFKLLGYTPFYLDLRNISLEEIEHSVVQFMPRILFSINYLNGLAELAAKCNLALVCWEIDHAVDTLPPLKKMNDKAFIFTYRKENIAEFKKAGFSKVEFMPMATDTDARTPVMLSGKDLETYSAPVSFVGNILSGQARSYRKTLLDIYRQYRAAVHIPVDEEEDPFEEILLRQARDNASYLLPQYFHDLLPGFDDYFRQKTGTTIDPVRLLAETAAAEKRLLYVAGLAGLGVKVWGDEGWKRIQGEGIQYMGPAGHKYELNKIYCGSSINLEVNRLYQMDVVNMRVFDILACGGFLLAEYSEGLEDLFEPGREIVTYRTPDEMEEKARYYLEHREEAREIASKGMEAVRNRHTVKIRVEQMLRALN